VLLTRIKTLKTSALFKSAALLCSAVFFAACGGTSGTDSPNDNDVIDFFPTSGQIDLMDYIPQTDKNVTFSVIDSTVNVNGEAAYTNADGLTTLESTHDGLDLDDYVEFAKFITLDAGSREARSFMEFGSNYLAYTIDHAESSIPRFYDDNDTVTFTLQFRFIGSFSAAIGETEVEYTEAYEINSSHCDMLYVGDYNISGARYADAIKMSCFGNRTKGGTVDGVDTVAYDYNYTSTTIFLPSMGIVSVDYKSHENPEANYTATWQPE
jgi:hypothetical protein